MNQKCCTTCPHVEVNEMTDERYCMLEDGREIRLRYAKKRPDWCPKLGKRGDGMNDIDKSIHELYREIKEHDIKWNDFQNIGLCESYYLWYYAENRLYIIMDVMTNGIYFIEARSPIEAFRVLASRLDEAMRAGQMVDEEYDELF